MSINIDDVSNAINDFYYNKIVELDKSLSRSVKDYSKSDRFIIDDINCIEKDTGTFATIKLHKLSVEDVLCNDSQNNTDTATIGTSINKNTNISHTDINEHTNDTNSTTNNRFKINIKDTNSYDLTKNIYANFRVDEEMTAKYQSYVQYKEELAYANYDMRLTTSRNICFIAMIHVVFILIFLFLMLASKYTSINVDIFFTVWKVFVVASLVYVTICGIYCCIEMHKIKRGLKQSIKDILNR